MMLNISSDVGAILPPGRRYTLAVSQGGGRGVVFYVSPMKPGRAGPRDARQLYRLHIHIQRSKGEGHLTAHLLFKNFSNLQAPSAAGRFSPETLDRFEVFKSCQRF